MVEPIALRPLERRRVEMDLEIGGLGRSGHREIGAEPGVIETWRTEKGTRLSPRESFFNSVQRTEWDGIDDRTDFSGPTWITFPQAMSQRQVSPLALTIRIAR